MKLQRKKPPHPHDYLPEAPALSVTSEDFEDGQVLDLRHAHGSAGGANVSPQLSWTAGPTGTESYSISCFDPDAPTGSGWWHWLVVDIPANVHSVPAGGPLPAGAVELRNDFGEEGYGGSAPPQGDYPHRYIFTVTALGIMPLGLSALTPLAMAGMNITTHTLARGQIIGLYSH
ncbi:MAG: YbhB/YbcL family Raf kinase inhibitor-like protein [Actinobacteria bacterium]|nr:YbhB/YbcL family Raf kinase inhibitor-like protein [Actinomycetota bacterium]